MDSEEGCELLGDDGFDEDKEADSNRTHTVVLSRALVRTLCWTVIIRVLTSSEVHKSQQ